MYTGEAAVAETMLERGNDNAKLFIDYATSAAHI